MSQGPTSKVEIWKCEMEILKVLYMTIRLRALDFHQAYTLRGDNQGCFNINLLVVQNII